MSPQETQLVIDYIYSHISTNMSLHELSSLIPTSVYNFCRLFRNTVGITPHQYMIRLRVEEAKRLLKERKLSIAEISLHLGFANQSHFTRTFSRNTGTPPGRYSKMLLI
jgi:AraC family transcriptional regulator